MENLQLLENLKNSGLDYEFFNENQFPIVLKNTNAMMLENWIQDNKLLFSDMLTVFGAILLRDFKINTISKFEKFTGIFEDSSLEYKFRSSPRFAVGSNVYTSTSHPKEYKIYMHSEGSYNPNNHPTKIVFCCLQPAEKGGETPIADNRRVLKRLRQSTVDTFLERGVCYKRNINQYAGLTWQEVFQTTSKETVEEQCKEDNVQLKWISEDALELLWTKKPIWEHPVSKEYVWFSHVSFFNKHILSKFGAENIFDENTSPYNTLYGDKEQIQEEIIDEIINAYEEESVYFPWQKGDVLFLDNMLSAHGRNSYEGKRKVITSLF